MQNMAEREKFGRFGAMMAMAGSAVGLGNMWRFPYLLGEYGGAAFLLVYLACALLIALPIFIGEFVIGRRSSKNCMGAFRALSDGKGIWNNCGILFVITCTIILSFYSVIGGWSLEYFFKACTFTFHEGISSDELSGIFSGFVSSVWPALTGFLMFLWLTVYIVRKGIKSGIERFGKIVMPVLALIVIAIAIYVFMLPGSTSGYEYMFKADFSKLNGSVILAALGQSFFSVSLGCGCIITYASYVAKKDDMMRHSVTITVIDIIFALISGCAIMPAVFAFGLDPQAGPSLVYETLPFIFSRMPAGSVVAIVFFGALLVATVTSSISMCEVGVAYLTQERGYSRRKSCYIIAAFTIVLGSLCSLSFGPLSHVTVFGKNIFDMCDSLSSNFLMIAGALLVVYFVGWKMKREDVFDEFASGHDNAKGTLVFRISYFLIRYVAPIAILVIFLQGIVTMFYK